VCTELGDVKKGRWLERGPGAVHVSNPQRKATRPASLLLAIE
jgi:hypothetical protein